jgi:hypothetical protein
VKTSKSKSGGLQMKMITKPSCAWTAGNKKVSLLAAGIFLSLCAFAAEPVWPSDFAEKLEANRVAATPGVEQIATSDPNQQLSAASVRKLDEKCSSSTTLSTKRYNRFTIVFK